MSDSPLLIKSKAFALDIIRVCNDIKQNKRESAKTTAKIVLSFPKLFVIKFAIDLAYNASSINLANIAPVKNMGK